MINTKSSLLLLLCCSLNWIFGQSFSCAGQCGGKAGSCWCDNACISYNDCCEDACPVCNVCSENAPPSSTPSLALSSPKTYTLYISKQCNSCYIAMREVTFYSDTGGTNPLLPSTTGVESLTATETSKLTYKSYDFSASTCIDGSKSNTCAGDGHICHSKMEKNPGFTFTLVSNVPPASFRIHYRRCSSNNFPPTRATLTATELYYSTGLSNSVNSELYKIENSFTWQPSSSPSLSHVPTKPPTMVPSRSPSSDPTTNPSSQPSKSSSHDPTNIPSILPSSNPTLAPTGIPSSEPSNAPSMDPSCMPSDSAVPSNYPTSEPSNSPTLYPSGMPSGSAVPSNYPTSEPSNSPSLYPSGMPSDSAVPSNDPTSEPSNSPSLYPSGMPSDSAVPSNDPTSEPSLLPSKAPSIMPSFFTRAKAIRKNIELAELNFAELVGDDMPMEENLGSVLEDAREWVIHDDEAQLDADDESLFARYCWAILNLNIGPNNWSSFSSTEPNDVCQWTGIECKNGGKVLLKLDYSSVEVFNGRRLPANTPVNVLRQRISNGVQRIYTAVPVNEVEMTVMNSESAVQLANVPADEGAAAATSALSSLFTPVGALAGAAVLTAVGIILFEEETRTDHTVQPQPTPTTSNTHAPSISNYPSQHPSSPSLGVAPTGAPSDNPSFIPSISSSPSQHPSSQPSQSKTPSNGPTRIPSFIPSLSNAPSVSSQPSPKPILVGANAPYYKELHGDDVHRAKYHAEDEFISKLIPYYEQDPVLFKHAVRAIVFQKEFPAYPRYSEQVRSPGFVASVRSVPPEDQEAFKNTYLNRTKTDACPKAGDTQYQRWEWANENVERFINMMRLSGHSDTKIQQMFNGMPLWAPDVDTFIQFRKELAPVAKKLEEELGWGNIVFVFTGSSVNGFSQNPCKGTATIPSWITSTEKSDVDISIHANGVNEFATVNADKVRMFPTTADELTTGIRFSPIDDENGNPKYEIFGETFKVFYDKWYNLLPGGLQFTAYEDSWPIPPWESRVEYAR